MAAITSTTESWNNHKFSEVESHIKGNYSLVNHTHSGYVAKSGDTMTGCLAFSQGSGTRNAGIIGTYDPNKAAAIWAMGSSYQISTGGTDFGNLYGAAYAYFGDGYTFGANYSLGHSFVWCQNGGVSAALGDYVYSNGGFKKKNSSNNYVLLGGGGHAAISGLSVSYATTAGSATDSTKLPLTSTATQLLNSTSNDWGWEFINKYGDGNNKSIVALSHGGTYGVHIRSYTTSSTIYILQAYNQNGEMFGIYADGRANFGGNVGIKTSSPAYELDVNGSIRAQGWLRTSGTTGWYSDSYDGGWYMTDENWIRNYNLKPLHIQANNTWGGGGHKLMIDCYNVSNASIGLRNQNCSWYICSNDNRNFYFSYRPTSGASGYESDYYPCYISPTAGFVSNYGVSALSDARHKQVVSETPITVEQIAKMPSVLFKWNDGRNDNTLHVGTLAQNWQDILPEVVSKANDEEGTLSVQYGVAALVSSITTARKVVNHEERIKELEEEVARLKANKS